MDVKEMEQTCSRCDMPRHQWQGNDGEGVLRNDQTYCCQGCAEGTGCTCGRTARAGSPSIPIRR